MNNKIEFMDNNSYDEVPYESYPYSQSHPHHLMTLGVLFGMQPVKPEGARILELGCAAGGNIIPHAINCPKAEFIGVDLSKIQIDEAHKHVEALGLKNIKFQNCSITDIDESFGKFDYIICHGVISWVPKFVRDKIFVICQQNLSENGIAYISYNTLPGWNMIRTIRDMMLYHSAMFSNVQEKISQSRLLLEFIKDSLEGSDSPYASILRSEAALLSKQSDHYLRHDHLEEDNTQYYFHNFIEEATKHDLQYLSDSSVSTMYLGNMPAKVAEKLKAVNDIVRTEQYMDFITNRRFRATLLCHKSVSLNRSVNVEDIEKFNMTFNIVPEKTLDQVDFNNSLESLKFFYNGNKDSHLSTSSPYMKAILYSFFENINNPISVDKLVKISNQKLGGNKLSEVKSEFLSNAMRLVLQGYISITLLPTRSKANLDKPQIARLPEYQASKTDSLWVTNLRHEAVGISLFEKYAFRYMNGKNTHKQIIEAIMLHVKKGEINLNRENVKIELEDEIYKELKNYFNIALEKANSNALLV